ncbi:MAG: hypothetical protein M1825_000223 [Sarcosagium campestre]|nr:MAG: hypothetical protein M1825_000223 [Sarcosagium campestre]
MKYIAECTTIPIPQVFAYGFGGDYPTGLPFIAMEYIAGDTLLGRIKDLDVKQRSYVYRQLADIFFQLRQQEFPRIGALTLDDDDGSWKFKHNRPLNIDFSNAQLDGQEVNNFVSPSQTYNSAFDYCKSLMTLEMVNYLRQRDRVIDEDDARWQLFTIHRFRDNLKEWLNPEYDNGPFVLMHGDFLPGNIMVDESLRIIAIIDWEFSQTVPLQLFVPPKWLRPFPGPVLHSQEYAVKYAEELRHLNDAVIDTERKWLAHSPQIAYARPPLSHLWKNLYQKNSFGIAHALLRRTNIPRVLHAQLTNSETLAEDIDVLTDRFFTPAHNPNAQILERLVQRKIKDARALDAVCRDEDALLKASNRPSTPLPPLSAEDNNILMNFVRDFIRDDSQMPEARRDSSHFIRNACLITVAGLFCWIFARRRRLL